jgi:peptide/nickel transport system substrate-binding protein
LALVAALCLTVAGCSQPSTGGSGGGGEGGDKTITVALAEQPDALDPTVASTYVGRIVFANMCEKLYDTGDGLGIEPQLAAGMSHFSDGG